MTLTYVLLTGLVVGAIHLWAWRGAMRRTRWAVGVYFGWALLAALGPAVLLFGLIGLEEALGTALVPERLPLVTGLLLVLGLMVAIVGAIIVAWQRRGKR